MSHLFEDDDPHTVAGIIRAAFKARGGNMPARVLAKTLIDEKILPEGVVERATLKGVTVLCRHALSANTAEGLPFAQPVGNAGRARWLQLDLFTQAQMFALIRRHAQQLGEDHEQIRRLYAHCLERYGVAPEIPELIMPSDVDAAADVVEDDDEDRESEQ
jgi:hypothetical protein